MNILNYQLEPLVAAHASEMFIVLSDPAIYEFENAPPDSVAGLLERYRRLETRLSPDGKEHWLNWVIRVESGQLAGYVQATVHQSGLAYIAYELNSSFWRQGLGSSSVSRMLGILQSEYGVHSCVAVLKAKNYRSKALLERLGFSLMPAEDAVEVALDSDEIAMFKMLGERQGGPEDKMGSDPVYMPRV